MDNRKEGFNLEEIRKRLQGSKGKEFWRNLDQVAETPEFRRWADDEFPERQSMLEVDRRSFIKLMGATMVMASLAGCRHLPEDKIVPRVVAPEDQVPGKPLSYATAMTLNGFAKPLWATSRSGRPVKLDGNGDHPASLGSTDVLGQMAIWTMYDPDRQQVVQEGPLPSSWDSYFADVRTSLEQKRDAGVAILTGTVTSPTLAAVIQKFVSAYPNTTWHQYESTSRDNVREGSKMAFGGYYEAVYDFKNADVVFSLDADFFATGPGNVRYARDFATRRQVSPSPDNLNRMYAVESTPSMTGAAADHFVGVKPSQVESVAFAIASRLGVDVAGAKTPIDGVFLDSAVADLQAAGSRGLVIAGDHQPPVVHALAHAINATLGSVGTTVRYIASPEVRPENHTASIKALVDRIAAQKVDHLIILGGNPAYTAPTDIDFASAMRKVHKVSYLGLYADETANALTPEGSTGGGRWFLPSTHFLEEWGDARSFDGTLTSIQPLIAPLYEGKSATELLLSLMGDPRKVRDVMRETWKSWLPAGNAEHEFERVLEVGLLKGSSSPQVSVSLAGSASAWPRTAPSNNPELLVLPDPTIHGGEFANSGWAMELPIPMTSLCWDNAFYMSAKTAADWGLESNDEISLTANGNATKGLVWVLPGHPNGVVTAHLGYGHNWGRIAESVGFNAGRYRTTAAMSILQIERPPKKLRRVGGTDALCTIQMHNQMEGGDLVRSGTVAELKTNPALTPEHHHDFGEPTLYNDKEFEYDGYKWAMTIDLNLCIGCGVCTIACQTENNIPTVGKIQVQRGREMHWIRVDRYYTGPDDHPGQVVFQPVPCMQCENAPCEPVCPVAATTHSKEGLNQMVYNRCVGTRYCSNNCPYKVRRFNYLNFGDREDYPSYDMHDMEDQKERPKARRQNAPSLKLLNNPDVTVRGRGVMEKCTYCVQRINAARIDAKKQGRKIEDGEILTACQQACPTHAITFGDMSNPNSAVSKTRADGRNYVLLKEVNTRPRTSYLGRVRNVNRALHEAEMAMMPKEEGH
ncbi:MAG: TAT-variant-translocated molybdopterin oxidoreductase [Fimbriimonadaceae bacterium]|nr:TAT-variant-translocated molybdopterin oxidoreductase [Fimbriimonadaceae bacterium]